MISHWFGKRTCPGCGKKMFTDGNNWYCSHCGFEYEVKNQKRSKKYGYRTAHDRDHRRNEQERDE